MKNKIFIISLIFVALGITSNYALAGTATVSWNANTEPDLAGYKIYYGTSPRSGTCPPGGYASNVNVGKVTSYTFNNLTDGATYYFSVTAYDTSNNESTCSAQVSKVITPVSTKFSINDKVQVSSGPLNVRQTPSTSGTLLGTQATGALGTVIGGPTSANGFWWWQISFDSSPSGWSVEDYLVKYTPTVITNLIFTPVLESTTNVSGKQFTVTISQSAVQRGQFSATPNAQGQIPLPSSINNLMPGNYDIYSDTNQYLKAKRVNTPLASDTTVILPTLKAADLNDDGTVNSLDWSIMNTNWFTTSQAADLNRDNIVNSLDFSWMNKNWLLSDEN